MKAVKYIREHFSSLSWLLILVILITLAITCDRNKIDNLDKTGSVEKVKKDKYFLADIELKDNLEKIVLLSYLSNMDKDSLNYVLREYIMETENNDNYDFIIKKVSKKYSLSADEVAKIIFKYKYEVLTEEEIQNKSIDELDEQY